MNKKIIKETYLKSLEVKEGESVIAPKLKEVGGYVNVYKNATFKAPKLEKVGGFVDVYENAAFEAPKLKRK